MPEDPHGENTYHVDDECSAVGMGVLDCFAEGAEMVVIRTHEVEGQIHYHLFGLRDDDGPTLEVGADRDGGGE